MLQDVKLGKSITYKELLQKAGWGTTKRMISSALWTNPVALIIPCHRILKGGGALGRYSGGGGSRVKDWLLRHENNVLFAGWEELKVRSVELDALEAELDTKRADFDEMATELDNGWSGYRSFWFIRKKGREKLIKGRSMMREGRDLLFDPEEGGLRRLIETSRF